MSPRDPLEKRLNKYLLRGGGAGAAPIVSMKRVTIVSHNAMLEPSSVRAKRRNRTERIRFYAPDRDKIISIIV